MSDTMSGPNDWLHFYEQSYTGQVVQSSVSDATTVTTTAPPAGTPTQLSPEGRVSRPIRRRSRASRRTPTTLLNTDTTNFRAMVQQFTGGPSAPFAPTASSALPNLGFGFGSRAVPVNPNGLMLASSGYRLEQQQLYHQPQNQHYMYREGGDNSMNTTFFQRLSNPTAPNSNVTDEGGLFVDHGVGGRFFPSTSST